jgi:hypothetical protein
MARRGTWIGVVLVTLGLSAPREARADDDAGGVASAADVPAAQLATALDLGLYLGVATLIYVLDASNNQDHEYDWSLETLKAKLITRDGLRFDDNALLLNTPGHALSGTLYFVSARAHGANQFEALGTSLAAAAAWELGSEYLEVLSLNDLIITPTGGLALGESVNQLGEFFRRSEPRPVNRILGAILMGPGPLLPWHATTRAAIAQRENSPPPWGRIHVGAGVEISPLGRENRTRTTALADLHARIVTVPGYGSPDAKGPIWSTQTLRSELRLRFAGGPTGLDQLWISGEAMWSGAHGGRIDQGAAGLYGAEWVVGPSALYDHRELRAAAGDDQLGAASPLGVNAHLAVRLGAPALRIDASVHPVFAAVRSQAWPQVASAPHPEPPEVLSRHGYYFATGARGAVALELDWGAWRVRAAARAFALSSAEWMLVPSRASTLALSDQRLSWEAMIGHRLPWNSMVAAISFERDARWSRVEETSVAAVRPSVAFRLLHEL